MLPGNHYHRDSTDSTQNDARQLIAKGIACHGDICTASYQSAGRGRVAGRIWEGEKGQALMMTLILEKREIPSPSDGSPAVPLSLILGLAVSRSLEKTYKLTPRVKWPNDIYLNNKKVAGILCESEKAYFLCGMGINLNQNSFTPGIKDKAISLKQILNRSLDQSGFRIALKEEIFLLLNTPSPEILDQLDQRLYWKNEKKTLLLGDPGREEKLTGILKGLNPDGALLFESEGELKKIYSAEFLS